VTFPFGSRSRQVSVELDGPALLARGLTAVDVVGALNAQNLALPTGIAKIGPTEYSVGLNGSPTTLAELGDIPIRSGAGGATIALRDVAHVRDGFQPATNIVRRDGQRGLLLSVLKNGGASTLDIIEVDQEFGQAVAARDQVKARLALAHS
jgi:multidrug efflux pump subunit AcrB